MDDHDAYVGRVVFLVPRRADHGQRDRLWEWARARWSALFPTFRIYEGEHTEGLFNRSAAINAAAKLADQDGRWSVAVILDADVFLRRSQVAAAIESAKAGVTTWAHYRWRGVSPAATEDVLAAGTLSAELSEAWLEGTVEQTNPISWSCAIATPRAVFEDLGGFDERFRGWGWEDLAWMSAVCGLHGHKRIDGDVWHLWHDRPRTYKVTPEYYINARLGRRYMLALRRDHSLHDRPTPSDAAELERDIANLRNDDARLTDRAASIGLPDWSDWWPTLRELVDGAKAGKVGPAPRVTVVVHTGGRAVNWPTRARYLEASLASLAERVSGPIVQRVLYSDWDRRLRPAVAEVAERHGFRLHGDGNVGYTRSMQRLWQFLRRSGRGEYVFATEDDFTFDQAVDLGRMIEVLEAEPKVAQLALLRQACYPRELERGGILGWPLESFTPERLNGHRWLSHSLFWTANPSLFRRSLVNTPWPTARSSEAVFGEHLVRAGYRFAFWGDGAAEVTHIGEVRAGRGY